MVNGKACEKATIMRHKRGCLVAAVCTTAVVAVAFVLVWREMRPHYNLAMLHYHGHETKSAVKQEMYGNRLIADGVAAAPLIADQIEYFRYDGRYGPSPFVILRQIGEPARNLTEQRLQNLTGSDLAKERRRYALLTALIVSFDQDQLLDRWMQSCRLVWKQDDSIKVQACISRVNGHLKQRYGWSVPDAFGPTDAAHAPISFEFAEWASSADLKSGELGSKEKRRK